MGADSLAALKPADGGLLFGTIAERQANQPKNLTVAQLLREPLTSPPLTLAVAGYFQAVAQHEHNPIVLTWSVLAMLAMFPECVSAVARATDPHFVAWFDGDDKIPAYERRFEQHLGGTSSSAAKTGLMAVVYEWQLYTKLAPFLPQ